MTEGKLVPDPGVVSHVEQWFRDVFGKGVEEVRADLEDAQAGALSLENWAKSHAHYADSVLNAVEELAKVADPAMTPEVTAAVTVAKEAATEAGRLLDDVITKM